MTSFEPMLNKNMIGFLVRTMDGMISLVGFWNKKGK
jgi:hypothetical protein